MRKFYFLLVSLFFSIITSAQTVLISPTGDGGFENGATFTPNGWTGVNGAVTTWYSSAASLTSGTYSFAPTGTNCVYLSTSATLGSWVGGSGTTTASTAHFYRDVTFPAGNNLNLLSFRWAAGGEVNWDELMVYLCPTTLTPTAGSPSGSSATSTTPSWTGTGTATFLGRFRLSAATGQTNSISIPQSAIGNTASASTMRLVFTWKNDGSGGTAPGVAIDDISLTSSTCANNPVTGTKSVGPSGDYATLTAALNDINNRGVSGNVFLELNASYTSASETFPITLGGNPCMDASNTVTIRPASGVATTLSITSSDGVPAIDFNGGKFYRIDGRPGGTGTTSRLTVENTSTSGFAARFINDATNNTIDYVTLRGLNTSTSGGVVLFSTTTGTAGNSNNTISNSEIRESGSGFPTNAIYSFGTSTAPNNGNTITGCNLINFYNSTSTSNAGVGILLSTNNNSWTISNNSFYHTATRTTFGASATFNGILINSSSVNGTTISGNYIGGTAPLCAGTPLTLNATTTLVFRGIQLTVGTTTPTSVQGNTIQNIAITTTSTSTAQSLISAVTGNINIGTVTGNTLGSQSATGSVTFVNTSTSTAPFFCGIIAGTGTPGTINIQNNTIGGIAVSTTSTATINTRGISVQGAATAYNITGNTIGSLTTANSFTNATNTALAGIVSASTAATNVISNNTVANLTHNSTAAAAQLVGIVVSGGSNTISGNTVRNLTSGANNVGNSQNASVIGIMDISTTAGQTITQNTIYALSNTNTGANATGVIGLHYNGATTGTNLIARNLIYGISSSGTAAAGFNYGISVSGGTTNIQNNMVLIGAGVNNGIDVRGISESVGTNNYYHNSVYVGGAPTTNATNSYAFISAVTLNTRNFTNNIFVNARSNSGSTGKHYGIAVGGTGVNPAGLVSNSNDIYVSGTGGVFGLYSTADQATLAAWRTATGQDISSFDLDPQFVAPTAATPDLHISPTLTTVIEGNGTAVASVTDDFDGQTRSGLTPTDIGADAGNFSGIDLTGPVISYTPLANTCAGTGAQTLTATITDISGVPTSGIGLPVAYFKFGASPTYTAVQGVSIGSNQYTFSIGAGSGVGDVVSYYVAAQDLAVTKNVSVFPSAGASGFTSDPPAATTAPTTPSAYTHSLTMSGVYTVGVGGDFTTLTAAVAAYNNRCLTGAVELRLTDASYSAAETFPITINANANASATNTLLIRPATGVTTTISGTVTSAAMILFNQARFVTIDGSNAGGTDRSLTIQNNGASTSRVIIIGSPSASTPAQSILVKNAILINGSQALNGILVGDGSTGSTAGYFNNIGFQNNSIRKMLTGIQMIAVVAPGNGSGTLITQNALNSTGTDAIRASGIFVQGIEGGTISNNQVGNFESTTAEQKSAIFVSTGSQNVSITGNTVSGIAVPSGSFFSLGIVAQPAIANAGITISNNTISGLSTGGGSTVAVSGIFIAGTGTTGVVANNNTISTITSTGSATANAILTAGTAASVAIHSNTINGVKNTNTFGWGANGIWLGSTSATANTTVYNNIIYDVLADGFTSGAGVGDNGYGIIISAGAGYQVVYNTVWLNTNQPTDGLPAAINVTSGVTAAGAIDLRNNIIANTQTTAVERYAIYSGAPSSVFSNIDNNNYWSAGPNLGFIGSNRALLSDIQAGFGSNTNSFAVAPVFVSPTTAPLDLHLSAVLGNNLCLNGKGTPITGITTDIDGQTRSATTPDIGADEFTPTLPTFLVTNQSACFGSSVDLTAPGVTAGSTAGQTFKIFTDLACTTLLTNPSAVTTSGTYYIKAIYPNELAAPCTLEQILPVTVTINALPTTFNVTGGGAYCATGAGVAVGLSGSESSVNYQLQIGGVNTGTPVAGTGSAISFGNQTAAGTYTVVATNATTLCQETMTGSVSVSIDPLPTQYNVTGGGAYCATGSGVAVGLSNSDAGINYQLQIGGVNTGSPVAGTGSAISFGNQTAAGTYTVVATNTTTNCTNTMTGSVVVTINPLPTQFTVTGGGAYCSTGLGSTVGLSGSEIGVDYQLVLNGTTNVGSPVGGTGSAISFGPQTTAGVYTVVATNATTTCQLTFTTSATVSIDPLPVISFVLSQPNNCNSNNGGADLTITGAAGPYSYNWTGLGIIPGVEDQTTLRVGSYTVVVTADNGCQATANFTLIGPGGCDVCPTIGAVSTTPAAICQNGTATLSATGLADLGVSYGIDFVVSSTALANPYTGTVVATVANGSLTGGGTAATTTYTFNTAGTQYVYAILSPAPADPGCRPFQSVQINVVATPDVNTVANQTVCSGALTTAVTFSGTQPGTVFNWTNSNPSIGLAASGTGDISSFTATNFTNAPVTSTVTVTPVNVAGLNQVINGAITGTSTLPERMFRDGVPSSCASPKAFPGAFSTGSFPYTTYTFTNTSGSTQCVSASVVATSGDVFLAAYTNSFNPSNLSQNYLADAGSSSSSPTATRGMTFNVPSGSTYVTVLNTTGAPTATFDLTLSAGVPLSCPGPSKTFTITVNPTPTVNTVAPVAACDGATVSVPFSGFVPGTVYEWTNSNTAIGLGASGTGNLSFTGTNAGTSPITGTVIVTPKYTNDGVTCTGTPVAFTITINPTPTVNAVSNQVVCNSGATTAVAFSGAVTGTTYSWTNSAPSIGLAASGTGDIASFTAVNTGTAPVVATITVTPNYTNGGTTCSGTATTFTITVNPQGQVNTVSNQTICNGANTTAVTFGTNNTGGTTTYSWTNNTPSIGLAASGTGNIGAFAAVNTGTAPVTATITVTPSYTSGGETCSGSPTTFTYTVNPTPTVNAVSSEVVCNNASTTAVTFGGAVTGTVYNWTNSNTAIGLAASGTGNIASFTATNSTSAPITATITVTPSYTNGGVTCTGTSTSYTITVNPTPTVNTVSNQTLCNGAATTAVAFTGAVTGTVYTWTNNNTSIGLGASGSGDIASFTATNSTNAPVTATITVTPSFLNGGTLCTGTPRTFTITVNPTPNAVATPAAQTICSANAITGIVLTGNVTGTTYSWTRDNATAVTGIAASGTGNIAGTLTNTTSAPVTVTFTITPSANGCTGTPITATVLVNPTPNAVATPAAQTICSGSAITTIALTGNVAGTTYSWTRDNTTAVTGIAASGAGNITGTLTNTTTAPVTVTFTITPSANGCTGTPITATVIVNPIPTVNAVSNQVVCNRASTTAVSFTGAVTGTVYSWTNNTPSIGLAASGTGNIAAFTAVNTTQAPIVATITVTPSFTNGGVTCTGTPRTFTITVNPTPIVVATDLFNQRICISDAPVALNATPVGGSWSGIGVSGFNFVPSAAAVGNFLLTYTYTNQFGCTSTDTTTAKVSACDERNRSLEAGGAILYPNPNGGQFNLRVNSTRFQFLQMRIYNALGQLVSTKQWNGLVYGQILPVDMRHLAAGVYTVRVIYDGGNLYEDRGYQMLITH